MRKFMNEIIEKLHWTVYTAAEKLYFETSRPEVLEFTDSLTEKYMKNPLQLDVVESYFKYLRLRLRFRP